MLLVLIVHTWRKTGNESQMHSLFSSPALFVACQQYPYLKPIEEPLLESSELLKNNRLNCIFCLSRLSTRILIDCSLRRALCCSMFIFPWDSWHLLTKFKQNKTQASKTSAENTFPVINSRIDFNRFKSKNPLESITRKNYTASICKAHRPR